MLRLSNAMGRTRVRVTQWEVVETGVSQFRTAKEFKWEREGMEVRT